MEGGPGSYYKRGSRKPLCKCQLLLSWATARCLETQRGGDRRVKSTNTKQCHLPLKLAVTTAPKVRSSGVLAAATGTTLAEGFPRPGWEAHH